MTTDSTLNWPIEQACPDAATHNWSQPHSNICLDFHGDPCRAKLVVFSDGNHHMALEQCLKLFLQHYPQTEDIFYATTPPAVLLQIIKQGEMRMGNLTLSRQPDIFIGPQNILMQLQQDGLVAEPQPFMQSRCNVMLVAHDNPKNIQGIADLLKDDVKLFMSNPETEKASYQVYVETIFGLAEEQRRDIEAFKQLFTMDTDKVVYGERIHHRELPQCIADGQADVAVVYYHLALRYTRIFPGLFSIIPLGGNSDEPQATPAHHITNYYAGIINTDNELSPALMSHLLSDQTTDIYTYHGLVRP